MPAALITDGTTEGLRPLGTAGQRSFELITGTISAAEALDERHMNLFAEAVDSTYGDRFDWYPPVEGASKRLLDLPPEDANAVRSELAQLVAEILTEAERLKAAGDAQSVRIGTALEQATHYPGDAAVFVVETVAGERQPVIANWGWVEDRVTEARSALVATDRVQPVAPAVVAVSEESEANEGMSDTPETQTRAGINPRVWWALIWLGWLLLLGLVLFILYLLIEACALRLPGVPGNCPEPVVERPAVFAQSAMLQDQIAALDQELHAMDRACQPVYDPTIPTPQAEYTPPHTGPLDADEARLRDQGATLGELTFSLLWGTQADLDMHVTCATGQIVSFSNEMACGGVLDVDSNAVSSRLKQDPVENIYFSSPTRGTYEVRVNYYSGNGLSGQTPFRLRVQDGERVEMFDGSVGPGQVNWTTRYVYGEN